jgi:hypothetical protein
MKRLDKIVSAEQIADLAEPMQHPRATRGT